MNDELRLPTGAIEDPDNPGWYSWGDFPRGSFAAQTGRLLFKPDGPGRGLARMLPTEAHLNMGGSLHGGAVMSFIDMALFAGGRCAGMGEGHYVTLDCSTRFIARGRINVPLDAHVRLLKQTKGGLVFMHGHCEQEGEVCYSFTGTLKKIKSRSDVGDEPRS
ncbi:MAG TPA: PaaI family thioesterase [Sphingomicrobium sp.]|nr:PaaI family thioesterase [Sphingomicrobium sp.]